MNVDDASPIEAPAALRRVMAGEDLSRTEMETLIGRLMDGDLDPVHQAGLLVGLAMKGESVAEITGAAAAMRARVVRIPHAVDGAVDTCGTGGDGKGTFNVSTAAAVVAAAAGAPVAKHGNRSVSSRSGSADVLAALGVPIDLDPGAAADALAEIGIAFLFAPRLHPAMKAVMPVRKALGVRTLFNILGPLTNPAGARRQVLGVFARRLVVPLAQVLGELGSEHALVVHGDDGLDEITTTTTTQVAELVHGTVRTYTFDPSSLGIRRADPAALAGGSPADNAKLFARLVGDADAGVADQADGDEAGRMRALADIVALNAGAALYVAGRAEDLAEGLKHARSALDDGRAYATLQALRGLSSSGESRS
jgi:anthranilate phosphoribosyltransferase